MSPTNTSEITDPALRDIRDKGLALRREYEALRAAVVGGPEHDVLTPGEIVNLANAQRIAARDIPDVSTEHVPWDLKFLARLWFEEGKAITNRVVPSNAQRTVRRVGMSPTMRVVFQKLRDGGVIDDRGLFDWERKNQRMKDMDNG